MDKTDRSLLAAGIACANGGYIRGAGLGRGALGYPGNVQQADDLGND